MLAIRLQRTGRKGHAQFRIIVQDSHTSPVRGKVVSILGNYNPHTKLQVIDKEKAEHYLSHGAQPSDRVARLLQEAGLKLPSWVTPKIVKQRTIRNTEKLRKNRTEPKVEATAEPTEMVVEEAIAPEEEVQDKDSKTSGEDTKISEETEEPTEADKKS